MALYLVQHAKSLPKEMDPEQGLSEEGISDAKRIAEVAKTYRVSPSLVRHSGKKRARQTAEIFASALNPEKGVEEQSGLNPLDDVKALAGGLKSEDNLMIVAHLPLLERLVGYLILGSSERRVFKLQNGGVLCLDKEPDNQFWFIKWALMPKID